MVGRLAGQHLQSVEPGAWAGPDRTAGWTGYNWADTDSLSVETWCEDQLETASIQEVGAVGCAHVTAAPAVEPSDYLEPMSSSWWRYSED